MTEEQDSSRVSTWISRLCRRIIDVRISVPVLFFLLLMVLFTIQRLVIYLALEARFSEVPPGDALLGFLVGLRFDTVVSCMLAVPLVLGLAFTPASVLSRSGFKSLAATYFSGALALALLACITDFYFFREFDQRLDHKTFDYLEYRYLFEVLWEDFPVIPVFLVLGAVFIVVFLLVRRAILESRSRFTLKHTFVWSLVAIPLLFLGIRSSLGNKAINSGPAFFSNSPILSQLALNGLFTLREAVAGALAHEDLSRHLTLLPEDEAFRVVLNDLRRPGESYAGDAMNPLLRVTDSGRPRKDHNVVIVLMESLSWHYIRVMCGDGRLTPNLCDLADRSLFMDRCFAVGNRTPMGISGTLCGFPDLPGKSIVTRSASEGRILTLGTLLQRRGYETMFIHGGQSHYDHLQSFLRSNGFSRFVFGGDFENGTFRTPMGWCDGDLFDRTHREFLAMGDRPFLAVLLTLSFHRPYRIPPGKVEAVDPENWYADMLDSALYADWAIGEFMKKARQADYFDRTLFVFIADHTGGQSGHPISPASYRLPFIIHGPAILGSKGRRVHTVCSQADVAPTVLSLLGGTYAHCFLGSSVLDRPEASGQALMLHGRYALAFMDAEQDVVVVPFGTGARCGLFHFEAPAKLEPLSLDKPDGRARMEALRRRGVAWLQCADALYRRGVFRLREE